ncbi:MAG: PTS sugar transporter subunit IIA [Anaerolineales bacterium]|nr:PTS sugar transporter subunit IIA [Anaerolineales bacterium]
MSINIGSLLEERAILLNLEAESSEEVIRKLSEKLYLAGYVQDTFAEAAIEREKSLPTGLPLMGNINAAIPHTDIVHVKKPGLAMATLKNPVSFHNMVSPDEIVDVQFIILLALDEAKAQVEMLQAIASLLQNPGVIEAVFQAQTPSDVKCILSTTM